MAVYFVTDPRHHPPMTHRLETDPPFLLTKEQAEHFHGLGQLRLVDGKYFAGDVPVEVVRVMPTETVRRIARSNRRSRRAELSRRRRRH